MHVCKWMRAARFWSLLSIFCSISLVIIYLIIMDMIKQLLPYELGSNFYFVYSVCYTISKLLMQIVILMILLSLSYSAAHAKENPTAFLSPLYL